MLNCRRICLSALLVGVAISCWHNHDAATAADEKTDLSAYYGFHPLEVFKLEDRSANMVAGDLNGDGLTDLLIADNSHSRFDLLQQRPKKPAATKTGAAKPDVNELTNGWRFEHVKISVDEQIAAVALGDFNGDKRTDIAYFGSPDRLIVRHQSKDGRWSETVSIRLSDVLPAAAIIAAGDLNGDKRDDLVVLGTRDTYVVLQTADGKLATPQKLRNTSSKLGLAQIADFDGDGRNDLGYTATVSTGRVFCARLQGRDGRLGPELRFDLKNPRAFALAETDGRPGRELAAIESKTGRVKLYRMQTPAAKPGEIAERLIQYGFGGGTSGNRDLATGDIDGDGLIDVVVTDPESAQMVVFRQRKDSGLDLGTTFPGLVGSEQVRIATFTKNGAAEVVVLSDSEKTIGISRMADGRLTFPRGLPILGEPVAFDTADLDRDGVPEVVYLSRTRKDGNSSYAIRALRKRGDVWSAMLFGKTESIDVKTSGSPKRLMTLDVNQDGRPDFLVFPGLDRPPVLFIMSETGVPTLQETKGGIQLGNVEPGAVNAGVLEKPAILVAQKNFARNLRLGKNGQWTVVDQYNAAESNADIAAAATLDLDGKPGNEIVLVDTGVKKLRLLQRDGSLYRQWREVELGDLQLQSVRTADLNGDGREDLLLFGREQFAVLYAGRPAPKFVEIASFESKLDKPFFSDLVAGDLNGDGHIDLAVIDTSKQNVEILDVDPRSGLRHGIHFKLFEQKSFGRTATRGNEPRESLIADVTNDGRPDLILLIHDRVLIYPQDAGD